VLSEDLLTFFVALVSVVILWDLGQRDRVKECLKMLGAFGSGGLRARLGHHLESTAEPRFTLGLRSSDFGSLIPWIRPP